MVLCQSRANRRRFIRLRCVKLPKLTPDFCLEDRGWNELAIAFKVDINSHNTLARIDHIFCEVLVHDHEDFMAEERVRLQVLVQVQQVKNVKLVVLVDVQDLEAEE